MQIKKIIVFCIVVILSLQLVSCYDSVDIDDMAYILAIGIDEEKNSNNLYTFQIAVPLNISGGVETGFAESEESVTVQNIPIIAKDLFSAIETTNSQLAKEVNISHCKIVLLSENVSSDTLQKVIYTVNNYDDFRPDTLIALCESSAKEYLNNISSPFEKNPARYYDAFFKKNFSAQSFYTGVNEFDKNAVQVIPLLTQKAVNFKSAIIVDYKKIKTLSEDETLAFKMLTGKFTKGNISLPESNNAVILRQAGPPRIYVKTNRNKPNVMIKLNFYTNLSGAGINSIDIKKETEKHIKKICSDFLYKTANELGVDVINIKNISKPGFLTIKEFENYKWSEKIRITDFSVAINCELKK